MNYRNVCAGAVACNVLWACSLFIDLSPPVASSDGGISTVDARDDGKVTLDAEEPKVDAELGDAGDAGDASSDDLRYVFVTLQDFTGDFGSLGPGRALENADSSCKREADMYTDPGLKILNGNWLDRTTTGAFGDSSTIGRIWSLIGSESCTIYKAIYCFETRS
jgi:hypothetical protein